MAVVLMACLTTNSALAQTNSKWTLYNSFSDITEIAPAGGTAFALCSGGLFSYNSETGETAVYDKTNCLSDASIKHIAWSKQAKQLVIAYENSNVDLLTVNGNVTNVPDIYMKSTTLDKTINHIYIDGAYAYMSLGLGVTKLDVKRGIIVDTYQLGFGINYTYTKDGYLYAASKTNGLYRGKQTDNLLDTNNWQRIAVEMVKEYCPHAVILDLELHQGSGNGLLFLKGLSELALPNKPFILVVTNNISNVTHSIARNLGADFVITKNQNDFSCKMVLEFLSSIVQTTLTSNFSSPSAAKAAERISNSEIIRNKISVELDLIGISPKLKGRNYLADAIEITCNQRVTNLCSIVAQKYKKTDAATIYSLLENEILPLFYNRNEQGFSEGWIKTIKNSIATIAPHYTMKRQLDDYYDKFYNKEAANFKKLSANNNRLAKELASWKETVAQRWDSIRVVSKDDSVLYGAETGKKYTLRYVIDEQGLNDAIGLELISIKTDKNGEEHIFSKREFEVVAHEGNNYTFEATFEPDVAGSFKSCVRMYPKNENLVYREDFCYVKWLD